MIDISPSALRALADKLTSADGFKAVHVSHAATKLRAAADALEEPYKETEHRDILVLGAGGRLGSRLVQMGCAGLTRLELDITDPDAVEEALDAHKPRVVINCAGWTNVDAAEDRSRDVEAVNWNAPREIAWACRDRNIRLTHLSTDYVICPDSSDAMYAETAVAGPTRSEDVEACNSHYAVTKWNGETEALEAGAQVVRLQWLYAKGNGGFVDLALRTIRDGGTPEAVTDQWGIPCAVGAIAGPLLRLAQEAPAGLWHLACRGTPASPADWLGAACDATGTDRRWVGIPRTSRENHHLRPERSVLDPSRAERFLGQAMPDWRDALRDEFGGHDGSEGEAR